LKDDLPRLITQSYQGPDGNLCPVRAPLAYCSYNSIATLGRFWITCEIEVRQLLEIGPIRVDYEILGLERECLRRAGIVLVRKRTHEQYLLAGTRKDTMFIPDGR